MMVQIRRARQQYAAIEASTRAEQASPHRVVEMLYDELLSALRQAGIAIKNNDLALKSKCISRALSILHGLESALDFDRGGTVAESLSSAYHYLRQEVIAAAGANDPTRLSAAADAVSGLADAWRQVRP